VGVWEGQGGVRGAACRAGRSRGLGGGEQGEGGLYSWEDQFPREFTGVETPSPVGALIKCVDYVLAYS